MRFLVPMASRALPLLLVFVTFLFVNAEAWEMTSNLPFGTLWFTVLLMLGLAVLFLMTRLPEEVDRVDDEVDDDFIVRACAGTPLEQASREVAADPAIDPQDFAQVSGFERWNLILVLLVIQTVQVVLLSATVFVFFMLFGSLVMETKTQESWTGLESHPQRAVPDPRVGLADEGLAVPRVLQRLLLHRLGGHRRHLPPPVLLRRRAPARAGRRDARGLPRDTHPRHGDRLTAEALHGRNVDDGS